MEQWLRLPRLCLAAINSADASACGVLGPRRVRGCAGHGWLGDGRGVSPEIFIATTLPLGELVDLRAEPLQVRARCIGIGGE
jgi:hypothetical protein